MRRIGTITALLLLVACGSGEAEELPGDYGQIIASEDDCDGLQDIFDTAESADLVDVMAAADDRMREVGCYD